MHSKIDMNLSKKFNSAIYVGNIIIADPHNWVIRGFYPRKRWWWEGDGEEF